MIERGQAPLSTHTSLRLGGPALRLVELETADEVVAALTAADAQGDPVLVMGSGSNLVVADEGFDGTVLRVATRGVSTQAGADWARLCVAAGEPWDELVALCVAEDLAGVECLSGIPGSAGATPIQNVGAYGQEVAEAIVSVRAYDRKAGAIVELPAGRCRFDYRSSALRHSERHVVLALTLALRRSPLSRPVRYRGLARALGIEPGGRAPLGEVRAAVLWLRRDKGMLIDPADRDSVSAGSFFVNPILPRGRFEALERRAAERLGVRGRPPAWSAPGGRVKTSAAWLIEGAGFRPGYGRGGVGISSKHTLALVNRGRGTTRELIALAREVRDGVRAAFGVTLEPEPTLVGVEL